MYKDKKLFAILVLFVISLELANATAIFARQYNTNCNTCHVGVPPTLNTTGKDFFRNGMRFSQGDATTLQRVLSDEDPLIPFGVFLGFSNKSTQMTTQTPLSEATKENEVTNPTFTLFFSASLSENLSTFVGTKFVYAKPNPTEIHKELKLIKEKAYLQYNQTRTHVARAGILYIYPEVSENSGLSDTPDIYISPVDRVNLNPLHGLEYSYMTDNGFTFLVAGGVIGRANNERSIMGEINYSNEYISASTIVNNITATDSAADMASYTPSEIIFSERINVMVPLEFNFGYGYLNLTGVYEKNDRVTTGDYHAVEATVTIPIFETASLRFMHTNDNLDDKGYAFKYAHILLDNLFLNANLAKFKTNTNEYESISFGANFVY